MGVVQGFNFHPVYTMYIVYIMYVYLGMVWVLVWWRFLLTYVTTRLHGGGLHQQNGYVKENFESRRAECKC